ncbi:MBL fold metallo-hydrolase [Brevibacterium sp. BDJS002]|uniref:MBL fold metallo-hydrolase n=1 Tax=Brevibacterium sp. BDJS002 TaxID=3020906 RepID=UPI002307CFBB|nr:MBL fold metallo-hydrolase [Brevibacterium sp. BDJS002]WCE39408.1 MBL fold metallo-hydrolase [Brevibacterium sp. BDJS002]
MLLERIYDEDLSHASYFIGCQATGEAIVIDPSRDISAYQELAATNGMRIAHVTETHIHADFLSGTRELATATEATVHLSGEGGTDWQYGYAGERLTDGDTITVGNLVLQAVHTPGHTPEHMSFLLTDTVTADEPGFMFTGDFVFVGDLGRPDLLDEAAGGVDTRYVGAAQLYRSLSEKLLPLPDYVQILPAHGAGSACGKALGSVPSTTVGYERTFSWWGRHLAAGDEQGFVGELLAGQPDAPSYFGRMKRQNREGPVVLGPQPELLELDVDTVREGLQNAALTFVDTRDQHGVHAGTVQDAINIPAWNKPAVHAGWVLDPESDPRPLVLLADGPDTAKHLRNHFIRVGIDTTEGYVTSTDGLPTAVPDLVGPEDLDSTDYDLLLDVRNRSEFAQGTIPGAEQLSAGRVLWHQDRLPASGTIVSFCQSGVRNSVASSALRRAGHRVIELEGSYLGWQAALKRQGLQVQ